MSTSKYRLSTGRSVYRLSTNEYREARVLVRINDSVQVSAITNVRGIRGYE